MYQCLASLCSIRDCTMRDNECHARGHGAFPPVTKAHRAVTRWRNAHHAPALFHSRRWLLAMCRPYTTRLAGISPTASISRQEESFTRACQSTLMFETGWCHSDRSPYEKSISFGGSSNRQIFPFAARVTSRAPSFSETGRE